MASRVDLWGRVIVDYETVQEMLLSGASLEEVLVEPDRRIEAFNDLLIRRDKQRYLLKTPDPVGHSPEVEHARRAETWALGSDLEINLRSFLLELCDTQEQRLRVQEEMDLFEERGLEPLLKAMICMVDHLRQNRVVWGVGRGSSVASYVLFLIGVHKIDPMKYNLSIRDFLKY
jgi:DNA polymerase III alpha subunit